MIDIALRMADAMTQEAEVYLAGVRWRSDMGGLEQTFSTGGGLPLTRLSCWWTAARPRRPSCSRAACRTPVPRS